MNLYIQIISNQVDNKVNSRLMHIGELFGRTLALVQFAVCTINVPYNDDEPPIQMHDAMPWHFFDGKIFYYAYEKKDDLRNFFVSSLFHFLV